MKPNQENDFWRYSHVNNGTIMSFYIDGTFRGKHSSAQYLIEKYGMTDEETYSYLNNVKHL